MNWAESGPIIFVGTLGIGIEPSNWAESGPMAANVLILIQFWSWTFEISYKSMNKTWYVWEKDYMTT